MNCLIIDDKELNRLVMRHMLETANIGLHEAADAETGLRMIDDTIFDLVFIDYHMPGMDGLGATLAIRARADHLCKTPIIIVTGDVSADATDRAVRAGADFVLHKPISMEDLFNAVGAVLSMPHAPPSDGRLTALRQRS